MQEEIERLLLSDLKKAYKKKEIPVSALIVFNNKIIAHAYNKRIGKKDVTAHAEILVIKKAAKKLDDWRLNGCELYVTLEPCSMCREIIKESRIEKVKYYIKRDEMKKGFNKTDYELLTKKSSDTFQQILSAFFKDNGNR